MDFCKYTRGRISFVIPDDVKVVQDVPEFCAITGKSRTHLPQMLLLLDPPKGGREASEGMISISLPQSPELICTDVRRGPIEHPYKGYERITEELVTANNRRTWVWRVNLYPFDSFIEVNISGIGEFAQAEPIWHEVIDSIRLDPV